MGIAKAQGTRHHGDSVPKANLGRRTTQLQDPPPAHARRDESTIRSEGTEAPELRGVGSSVADVDPGSRPAQLQDSPDLRGDQSPGPPSDPTHNEFPNPSSSTCPPSGKEPDQMQSSTFEDLELSAVPGSEPLGSNQIVEVAPMSEASLPASEITQPCDGARPESFDHDEVNVIGGEEEPHNHPESSPPRFESPEASLQPKSSASQNDIFEAQPTTIGSDDASGSTGDVHAHTVTFNSRNPSELFTFLKHVPMDVALKNGTSDVLSFLRSIPKDLLEKALSSEDHEGTAGNLASDQGASNKATCTEPGCGKEFFRQCELRYYLPPPSLHSTPFFTRFSHLGM